MANSYYQTSYGGNLPNLTIGDTAGHPIDEERQSLINSTGSAVAYGLAVVEDSTAPTTKAKLPSATTDKLVGVAINAYESVDPANSNSRNYANGDSMTVETCGIVAMEAGEAITADDAVYIETSGADAGKPFASDGGTAGSYTLTLNKALADGVPRVQTITFSANLVTSNVFNMDIDGTAIDAVTFATSHNATMDVIVNSIKSTAAELGLGITVGLSDETNNRVIMIASTDQPYSATAFAITNAAVTAGASQATVTVADDQAGIAPASVSVSVNGTTVATGWAGSSEATMLAFGQELEALAAVSTATLSSNSLVLTLTSASPLTLASATVTGGEATPATLTAATGTAGVAATRIAWTKARFLSAAADGEAVKVRFDARIP